MTELQANEHFTSEKQRFSTSKRVEKYKSQALQYVCLVTQTQR